MWNHLYFCLLMNCILRTAAKLEKIFILLVSNALILNGEVLWRSKIYIHKPYFIIFKIKNILNSQKYFTVIGWIGTERNHHWSSFIIILTNVYVWDSWDRVYSRYCQCGQLCQMLFISTHTSTHTQSWSFTRHVILVRTTFSS